MGITRTASGLLAYEDFSTDTSGNYDEYPNTLSVSAGHLVTSGGAYTFATHNSGSGGVCVTTRGYRYQANRGGHPFLSANAALAADADVDGYSVRYETDKFVLKRWTNLGSADLATDTYALAQSAYNLSRVYRTGSTIVAKYGTTALDDGMSAVDATYAGTLYGGIYLHTSSDKIDWVDLRTAHTVTMTGLPAGSSIVCTDRTTPSGPANTAGGVAVADCGALLFGPALPWTVTAYSGADGTGDVLGTIDQAACLADSFLDALGNHCAGGGGDTFAYAADGGGEKYMMLRKTGTGGPYFGLRK